MHKAPIVEVKQMEHVVNERRILEEASHPFCVQLKGAYQDKLCLYLLQVWGICVGRCGRSVSGGGGLLCAAQGRAPGKMCLYVWEKVWVFSPNPPFSGMGVRWQAVSPPRHPCSPSLIVLLMLSVMHGTLT